MSAIDNIHLGRLIASVKMPYFRRLLLLLQPYRDDNVGTIGVFETGKLPYNEGWFAARTPKQAAGVLLHECMHLFRHHQKRRRMFEPEDNHKWAMSADLEINDDLLAAGLDLPDDGCYSNKFTVDDGHRCPDGNTVEWYYHHIDVPDSDAWACSGAVGGEGEGEGEGEGDDAQDQADVDRQVALMETAIQQAAKEICDRVEKRQGHVPAGLRKEAEKVMGKLNWRDIFKRHVRASLAYTQDAVDYTYRKISRRQAGIGYGSGAPILPGFHRPIPNVVVALDTSGSMWGYYGGGPKEIDLALGEAEKILKVLGVPIRLMDADAAVHTDELIKDARQLKRERQGGGGTSFVPAFEAAKKHRPDLFIYLTDGYGDAPRVAPPFETIWCIINSKARPANWGRYVFVKGD